MSKLFVGVEIDDNLVFEDKEELYSYVVVTVVKVLNLHTMELEDLSFRDCTDVVGFPYDDTKDSCEFKVKRSKVTDETYKYTCELGFSPYIKDGEVAVFKDGSLFGEGSSKLVVYFWYGHSILFNLYNSTFDIVYMKNILYSGFVGDRNKIEYYSLIPNLDIFEHCGCFSYVSENVYKLFDNTCMVNRVIKDTIVESGTDTLFINLEESTGVCNLVVPPSVNRLELVNFKYRWGNYRSSQITIYLPKDKVDDLAFHLVKGFRENRSVENSKLTDIELLKVFNLFVMSY